MKVKRPIQERVYREFKRVLRKTISPSKPDASRMEQLLHVPQQLESISANSQSQNAALQAVSNQVGAACNHLQHMAVDVQVLATRYDELSECVNGLQRVRSSVTAGDNKFKFYGQFSPPVDRFLFERYFPDINIQGTFIECGAFDGQLECSCKFFEETMGWTGYNLEPSPHIYANLQRNRPNSRNYQVALSNRIGHASFKLVSHPQLELNYGNGSLSHTDHHTHILKEAGCTFADIDVPLLTYKAFIDRESIAQVDLFVLDVEGHELDVIEGMQGCEVLPDVMCVEVGHTPLAQVRSALAKLGYVYDISSHVNAFFIQQCKLPLFTFRQSNSPVA